METTADQRLREQVSVASAIRELAADYLLGALPTGEYRCKLRELIARYEQSWPEQRAPRSMAG